MKKMYGILFLAVSLFVFSVSVAAAQDMYGALAYSYDSGSWGWAVDYEYQADANDAALGECGGDCEVVLEFQNTCAAFALGDGAYGWAYGDDSDAVQDAALDYCAEHGDGCEVVNWACTTR